MRSRRGRARAQRLEIRVTPEQKSLIERAAALQGRTVTAFVLTSVQDAAQRAIEELQQLALSLRDGEACVERYSIPSRSMTASATRSAAIARRPASNRWPEALCDFPINRRGHTAR